MPAIPALRSLSMPALVLMGFSLVALPLIGVIFTAAFYVDRLELESERLVIQGIQVTRLSDSPFIEVCAHKQEEISAALYLIRILSNKIMHDTDLEHMRVESLYIVEAMRSQPPQSLELASALGRFDSLHMSVVSITAAGN